MSEKLVISSKNASLYTESLLGGKAKNMAWLSRNSFPVPEWFVVTTDAFVTQLKDQNLLNWIKEQLSGVDIKSDKIDSISQDIRDRINGLKINSDIRKAIEKELLTIPDNDKCFFAVRSSAVGEDAADASFAGQMDSFLYQKGIDSICTSVLKVFASAFTDRAIRYRLNLKMDILEIKAAVIVQRMIDSEVSGVFFTAHPVNGSRKHGLISACYGSGEGVVSGECNTDEFTVELFGDKIEPVINEKDYQIIFDKKSGLGTIKTDVPEKMKNTQCLKDGEISEIKELGLKISGLLQFPQDIEWTIAGGKVYIVQTRPVTSLPAPVNPIGDKIVWDNSNIQESYCGVTTPLTFSFACRGYRSVYKQTYEVIGISDETIKEMDPYFKNLLGILKGRIYYNINNWYRCLLILPGFKQNKADMERMMGLQDPVDFVEDQELSFFQKLKKTPALFKALYSFQKNFRKMDRLVEEFRSIFQKEYSAVDRKKLHTLEMAELLNLLENLKTNLFNHWQIPIINDFYVMMMNGKVHRWLEKAKSENITILQNNLMSGEEGIESTEPTKFLLGMCDYLRNSPELLKIFDETENDQLLQAVQVADEKFYHQCLEYIELYGDRCMGELKLESITLRQDPSFIFAVLKNFLTREDLTLETLASKEQEFRSEAEKEAFGLVAKNIGKRKLKKFKRDLQKLRDAVKNRENMRLARTRAFGLARDIYIEIGNQLAFYGVLDDARDIFYVTEEELESYMDGRCIQAQFKLLVVGRKKEFESYESEEAAHHFATMGPVYHHNTFEYPNEVEISESAEVLQGIGCYPGVVEKEVKLIFSPKDELNLEGKILCTVRTDPGWAPLFPTAGGIIVERGSTLSHSAVVARELGIPAIVNVPGLTKIIKDGEKVRMDGIKGTIERLEL